MAGKQLQLLQELSGGCTPWPGCPEMEMGTCSFQNCTELGELTDEEVLAPCF